VDPWVDVHDARGTKPPSVGSIGCIETVERLQPRRSAQSEDDAGHARVVVQVDGLARLEVQRRDAEVPTAVRPTDRRHPGRRVLVLAQQAAEVAVSEVELPHQCSDVLHVGVWRPGLAELGLCQRRQPVEEACPVDGVGPASREDRSRQREETHERLCGEL